MRIFLRALLMVVRRRLDIDRCRTPAIADTDFPTPADLPGTVGDDRAFTLVALTKDALAHSIADAGLFRRLRWNRARSECHA